MLGRINSLMKAGYSDDAIKATLDVTDELIAEAREGEKALISKESLADIDDILKGVKTPDELLNGVVLKCLVRADSILMNEDLSVSQMKAMAGTVQTLYRTVYPEKQALINLNLGTQSETKPLTKEDLVEMRKKYIDEKK